MADQESIEHELSFDLALTRLLRTDRRRARSNTCKFWQSFQGFSDPFASQAGRSDWKYGETRQDAGLPEGAARDSLQFMVLVDLSFSCEGFAGNNPYVHTFGTKELCFNCLWAAASVSTKGQSYDLPVGVGGLLCGWHKWHEHSDRRVLLPEHE